MNECSFIYQKKKHNGPKDGTLLSEFGQCTLKALIIHVLGSVFNPNDYSPTIRVAT